MMAFGRKLCALASLLGAPCQAAPEPSGLGRVTVALAADVCAAYCLTALRVELYEYDADGNPRLSGSPIQADCGEASIVFDGLGAGRRVYVAVRGYDLTSTALLAGQSADVTVVADASQDATVQLAAVAAPTITEASPDPVSVTASATLTLTGTSFMNPLGRAGAALGATPTTPLPSTRWSDDTITVTLPADARGSEVTVTRCGIASQPFPVRLVGSALGTDRVPQAPGCSGRAAVAVASDAHGDLVAAFACDAGPSYVQRFTTFAGGSGLCPAAPDRAWDLPAAPRALAMAGTAAWVAVASATDNIVSLALDDAAAAVATPRATLAGSVTALAAATDATAVWALADGALVRVDGGEADTVDGIEADWTVTAIVGATGRAFAVATAGDGGGRLLAIPSADAAVTTYSLSDCRAPVALDARADGTRVVVACGGVNATRLVAFVPADGTRVAVDLAGPMDLTDTLSAVAFDGLGSAALARTSDGRANLIGFGAAPGAVAAWPGAFVGAGPLARVGTSHRFVVPVGGELDVLSPYDADGACAP